MFLLFPWHDGGGQWTPLLLAAMCYNADGIELLMLHGARVDIEFELLGQGKTSQRAPYRGEPDEKVLS